MIGGGAIPLADAPWQVSLWVYLDPPGPGSGPGFYAQCGGTLISQTVVLTAAHCLYDQDGRRSTAADVLVGTGQTDLRRFTSETPNPPVLPLRTVSRVSRHPRFETTITNDIAYLRLSSPVSEVPDQVEVIDTAEPADVVSYPGGTDAKVSGWGSTVGEIESPSFPTYPDVLHGT
ncbi:hypothetical protein B7486_67370, partial [cyanobacterium TDX16]